LAFAPGTVVSNREITRGKIWAARPMICVRDDEKATEFWLPRGALWKRPVTLDGKRLRLPVVPWKLVDTIWARYDVLQIVPAGAAHAVWASWAPDGTFHGWYVNMQEPLRRTAIGFDYFDQALDVVASADRTAWHWKDEDELAEGVARGVWSDEEGRAIREEGERVVARMLANESPFCDGYESFVPAPAWPIPRLHEGWDSL
jgi:predicted RNA-binding protein associated with RNAse of E/G family